MNDRYLFRGKRVDNGEWVIGSLAIIPDGRIEIGTKCTDPPDCDPMRQKVLITYEVIPETVGQCTGLKDKNGKLIFENDIVQDEQSGICYFVKWFSEYACYSLANKDGKMNFGCDELEMFLPDLAAVSNAYDNSIEELRAEG